MYIYTYLYIFVQISAQIMVIPYCLNVSSAVFLIWKCGLGCWWCVGVCVFCVCFFIRESVFVFVYVCFCVCVSVCVCLCASIVYMQRDSYVVRLNALTFSLSLALFVSRNPLLSRPLSHCRVLLVSYSVSRFPFFRLLSFSLPTFCQPPPSLLYSHVHSLTAYYCVPLCHSLSFPLSLFLALSLSRAPTSTLQRLLSFSLLSNVYSSYSPTSIPLTLQLLLLLLSDVYPPTFTLVLPTLPTTLPTLQRLLSLLSDTLVLSDVYSRSPYGVATMSRLLKIIGLFRKRAL